MAIVLLYLTVMWYIWLWLYWSLHKLQQIWCTCPTMGLQTWINNCIASTISMSILLISVSTLFDWLYKIVFALQKCNILRFKKCFLEVVMTCENLLFMLLAHGVDTFTMCLLLRCCWGSQSSVTQIRCYLSATVMLLENSLTAWWQATRSLDFFFQQQEELSQRAPK